MGTRRNGGLKPGSLTSEAVYSFDLEKRKLIIEDYDLFIPNKAMSLSEGFKIKMVNQEIDMVKRADLFLPKETPHSGCFEQSV